MNKFYTSIFSKFLEYDSNKVYNKNNLPKFCSYNCNPLKQFQQVR